MSNIDWEKLNNIEKLKGKLFSKDFKQKIEHREEFPHYEEGEVKDTWAEKADTFQELKDKFLMKTSMFKKFFIFSIVFFILAIGYSSYVFFIKNNTVSNENIEISVLSNAFTNGGEEYPLLLQIINKNNAPLLLADLVIEYPKSSESVITSDSERLRLSIGTIPIGATKEENIKLVLFGEQGSTRPINISLEYRVEGSNAIFVKERTFDVSINSTPINISVDAPDTMTSGKDFTFNVKTSLNATRSVADMLIKVDYPLGFQFENATPEPSFDNNIWYLGDLAPGGERNIAITGKMVDVYQGEEKYFRVWTGSQSTKDKTKLDTVFNSAEHVVYIGLSSIDARLLLNGSNEREYAVDTKTPIQGQIIWANNSDTTIDNLEIQARLSGNAVDRRTIVPERGYYNSSQDLIVWDKNYQSELGRVEPGEAGQVSFKVYSLPLYTGSGGLLSSPSIKIDVVVKGRTADSNGATSELSSSESKTVKIISDVGFSSKAVYYSGPFSNTGPIPPKAEQKTTYTVIWSLSNTANNIYKTRISARLPEWVSFTGKFSPGSDDLSFNQTTREVVWNVGSLLRGTSITRTERSVSFQIELLPSLSQIGSSPMLINNATLTGHDDFANVDVRVNKFPLDTNILNDSSLPPNGGKVVE